MSAAAQLFNTLHNIESIKHDINEGNYYIIKAIVTKVLKAVKEITGKQLHHLLYHKAPEEDLKKVIGIALSS